MEEAALKNLSKVEGFEVRFAAPLDFGGRKLTSALQSFAPEKLLPPFPKGEEAGIYGEALIGKLLDVADVSVVISEFPFASAEPTPC